MLHTQKYKHFFLSTKKKIRKSRIRVETVQVKRTRRTESKIVRHILESCVSVKSIAYMILWGSTEEKIVEESSNVAKIDLGNIAENSKTLWMWFIVWPIQGEKG